MSPAHVLESRLAEIALAALTPCDLGDGIEVVHDVEALELEMECELGEAAPADDSASTVEFARFSAPYERIELEVDAPAFRRATIEEARRLIRDR